LLILVQVKMLVFLLILGLLTIQCNCDPVLRYKLGSCNSLEPVYVEENWQYPGGGDVTVDDTELKLLDDPKKSRGRNPPYSIEIGFDQYRRNREYTIRLETSSYFDSFMLHARAKDRPDGNATLVGWFVTIPTIAMDLHCLGKRKSSVADKGRPVKLGNMTFTWRAPPTDYGPIKFVASIVQGNEYTVVETRPVTFNAFPVSIRGCGREMSCFRQCSTSPTCPPDESTYMVVMTLSGNKKEVVISLGGIVEDEEEFVAVGFGDDKQHLHSMDIGVCYREGEDIKLGHYLVEDKMGPPYTHRSPLTQTGSDIDPRTNFIWCQFRRPIMPKTMWDLDLSQPLFHFYFYGEKNMSRIYLPEMDQIWNSKMRRNFSEITNDIMFTGRASTSIMASPLGAFLLTLAAVVVTRT